MLLLLYFVLQLQLLNLSSPKTENKAFVSVLGVWRGRKAPLSCVSPLFYSVLFGGEAKEGCTG